MSLMSAASVFAFEGERSNIQKITYELFEDAKIKSYEHLYGFNDAPDFIYVGFENSGYAIYLRDNLELLEFSPKGSLPFPANGARKYYGGPANYFNKEKELLVNVVTRETIPLSKVDSETYSEQILELFSAKGYEKEQDSYNERNDIRDKSGGYGDDSHMPEDNTDLEDADLPGTAGTTYIPNYQYFFNNPSHGLNATGTCAAVAAQLLLSYNNYYNDRRIIDDQHLNGWNFITNTVTTPSDNPNHCTDPTSMTRQTLGSNGIIELDTNDTFFSHLVANIPASSSATDASNG